ncbi:hypothetical protein BBW69_09200 [Neisseria sp. RH3002v2f]|nr:hypothetical protein [Neisseria sp. RH3002v2f]
MLTGLFDDMKNGRNNFVPRHLNLFEQTLILPTYTGSRLTAVRFSSLICLSFLGRKLFLNNFIGV